MNLEFWFYTILILVSVIHLLFLIGITILGIYLWKKFDNMSDKVKHGLTALSFAKAPTLTGVSLLFTAWNWWRNRNRNNRR